MSFEDQAQAYKVKILLTSGQNVKEMFARVAVLCFDQAVLRETENMRDSAKPQIGSGGIKTSKNQSQTIGI